MFKMQQIFIGLLLGTLWSCGQDPLKNIPVEMQEGVLKTGFQHFSNFNDILVDKLLKVDLAGRNDLTMEFSEGVLKSYNIKFRLLNQFSSKYELIIKGNPFEKLPGSQWNYDSNKQEGTLTWRPSETFTLYEKYVKTLMTLPIQIKKRGAPNKGSLFMVHRNFTAIINKKYTPPKIYRIATSYNSYVNLSDDKWYRDYQLGGLNLNFYDSLYVGDEKRIKAPDNFIFYILDIFKSFNSISELKDEKWFAMGIGEDFDYFKLTDKLGRKVSIELALFIKEPYYHEVKKTIAGGACISESPDFLNSSVCLAPFTDLSFVDLSKELYVKHYNIPSHIQKDRLYYKIESQTLCGVYHKISSAFIIHKQKKWNWEKSCYLSWSKLNSEKGLNLEALGSNNYAVTENTEIYLFKEDSFEQMDKSAWPVHFYKLPEHIKWQLGGQQPIPFPLYSASPILPISLSREFKGTNLSIYFRDNNYSTPVYTIFDEENEYLIQNMPFTWTLTKVNSDVKNIWKRLYHIKLTDLLEKDKYTQLYQFRLNLKPVSADITGSAVKLNFNILPAVKANYIELFNPENFKISNQAKQSDGLQEWISSEISIETQIKQEFMFPDNFTENVLTAYPFLDGHKNLEDIIVVEKNDPHSNYACHVKEGKPFYESACECSEFVYYEKTLSNSEEEKEESNDKQNKNKPVYMESICSYKSILRLNTKRLNAGHQIISAYWRYNYSVDTALSVRNISANGASHSGQLLSVDREYLNRYSLANNPESKFNLHIFFNLKPEINCFSNVDSTQKTCQIRYYLDETSDNADLSEDKLFFSEQGVQANVACLVSEESGDVSSKLSDDSEEMSLSSLEEDGGPEAQDCICQGLKFVKEDEKYVSRGWGGYMTDEASFLELNCFMDKTKKGFIDLSLKTRNPYIYFLDPEVNDNIKSTVFKRLNIE